MSVDTIASVSTALATVSLAIGNGIFLFISIQHACMKINVRGLDYSVDEMSGIATFKIAITSDTQAYIRHVSSPGRLIKHEDVTVFEKKSDLGISVDSKFMREIVCTFSITKPPRTNESLDLVFSNGLLARKKISLHPSNFRQSCCADHGMWT